MIHTAIRTVAAFTLSLPAVCWAHGTPIIVNAFSGQLTIGNGLAGGGGYANRIFADPDSESWFGPGGPEEQLTESPGFQITGMSPGQSISLEILSRPDLSAPGHPQRWLWYWNSATQRVEQAPNDPYLDILSSRSLTPPNIVARQSTPPVSTTVKLADLASGDLGTHQHLLAYFLDDSPPAPAGIYGFFARVTAPGYVPSDPFLIALNLNVPNVAQYQAGAVEMNITAGLAGDFDADEDVDGRDLLAWQRTLGATGTYPAADGSLNGTVDAADLAIWKSQFRRTVAVPNAVPATAAIPEPAAISLAAAALLFAAVRSRSKQA